ncbi:MAG TPA: hypothetical protein VHU41_03600 [Thermoanaerobaculia bacterium]|nr:hypothetical protein [Thermoanaerobaculia bacterium]
MTKAAILFVVLAAGSLAPIWSNDYFWHSAAGSWIVAHRALPATDPLAVASSHERWVDGEWLFQVVASMVETAGGLTAISVIRALGIALFFAWVFVRLTRTVTPFTSACVVFFAWYGALPWLRERPAAIAAMLMALLVAIPRNYYVVIIATILLINIHPSAMLVPVLLIILDRRLGLALASAAALLVNPYGIGAITNPFHVARIASLPIFRNEEWGPTSLNEFRLFAVALVALVLIVAYSARRQEWLRSAIALAFFVVIALRFSRNQTIFYCVAPLLLEPHLRSIPDRFRKLLVVPVAITVATILAMSPFRAGVDAKFPVNATARVRALALPGNVFSSYGLGGFLEWAFLPERRVLTDGRNELFLDYEQRLAAGLRDPTAFRQFLAGYGVGIAYIERSEIPQWRPYFPSAEWTPIAADRAAVVLARKR